jgi:hypothetical protein
MLGAIAGDVIGSVHEFDALPAEFLDVIDAFDARYPARR